MNWSSVASIGRQQHQTVIHPGRYTVNILNTNNLIIHSEVNNLNGPYLKIASTKLYWKQSKPVHAQDHIANLKSSMDC